MVTELKGGRHLEHRYCYVHVRAKVAVTTETLTAEEDEKEEVVHVCCVPSLA